MANLTPTIRNVLTEVTVTRVFPDRTYTFSYRPITKVEAFVMPGEFVMFSPWKNVYGADTERYRTFHDINEVTAFCAQIDGAASSEDVEEILGCFSDFWEFSVP
ncbi:hypothetical protein [Paraburkholderia sp. C35]|uniref:hypothetical protein n=1 Tax=Paraburkholderia sp. C35 TaxID=2126993 RepID=UPI000D6929A0|nr:hypothetical protein [Paraburkholderia sp. C35]